MKPILFSGNMIRAILDGHKSQTRRIIKLADGSLPDDCDIPAHDDFMPNYIMDFSRTFPQWKQLDCPYGKVGDCIWVRESWQALNTSGQWWHEVKRKDRSNCDWAFTNPVSPAFEATPPRWMPSIHMPRGVCRIELEITQLRVERLNNISENDAISEGCTGENFDTPVNDFIWLWDSINAERGYSWSSNPFVWVISFQPRKE